MTVEEALEFFKNIPGLYVKLKTLYEVGLGYVQLGQPAPSLSGGEAQRVKLATDPVLPQFQLPIVIPVRQKIALLLKVAVTS